ncbi:MAG: transcriptional regulator [Planctomycetaceae bacterium]|nr:transcriptional regulator [Planctomycetaceae bacterium]
MNSLPVAIRTIRWMVRDTFRQSLASKLFWVMLGMTAFCTVFCLGMTVDTPGERERHPHEIRDLLPKGADPKAREEGIPEAGGKMTLGFGLFELDVPRFRADAVKFFQLRLAGILADTAGVLLALLWTGGFLPTFLDPQAITVLLAKPAARWSLLIGKYLGVVLFVTLHAVLFVAGTWIGIGISTGVWDATYWYAVPLLVINFAVFYAFSAFLAVWTRSTVVAVFGTLLFWVMCWAMNFAHHHMVGFEMQGVTPSSSFLVEAGYWVLPKPLDMSGIFFDAMNAGTHIDPVRELEAVKEKGKFLPELSVLTSLVFAAGILGIAVYEFRKMDY